MDDSGDEDWNDIEDKTATKEICQYQYRIVILLKSLLFKG